MLPETERHWQSQLAVVKPPLQEPPGREGLGQRQTDRQPSLLHGGGRDSRGKEEKIATLFIQPARGHNAEPKAQCVPALSPAVVWSGCVTVPCGCSAPTIISIIIGDPGLFATTVSLRHSHQRHSCPPPGVMLSLHGPEPCVAIRGLHTPPGLPSVACFPPSARLVFSASTAEELLTALLTLNLAYLLLLTPTSSPANCPGASTSSCTSTLNLSLAPPLPHF